MINTKLAHFVSLFLLILLLSGCTISEEQTSENIITSQNLPLMESSVITNTPWTTRVSTGEYQFDGDWLHIKKDDIAELILYIDSLNKSLKQE